MKIVGIILFTLSCLATGHPQALLDDSIRYHTWQYLSLQDSVRQVESKLEHLKLRRLQRDLRAAGPPTTDFISHHAMMISYDENHEQAQWVMHIITPDIIQGTAFRTNVFLEDPKISTGTAVEADYFLKELQEDSTYIYDDFGFDRGHLAASADFRWSELALKESFFYSNMSPQRAGFNRESWAEVESWLRGYVYTHKTQVVVVTAPVLHDELPKIERGVNHVSIPAEYIKVAIDLVNQRGFAIKLPNQTIQAPLEQFIMTIDEVEALLGWNLYGHVVDSIEEKAEMKTDIRYWIPEYRDGNCVPIDPSLLPSGHFNSTMAKHHIGQKKKVNICGTVVSTRYSRSGNLWMNLDKKFPEQVFSILIKEEDIIHFPFDPKLYFMDKSVCAMGQIKMINELPTMTISKSQSFKEIDLKRSR